MRVADDPPEDTADAYRIQAESKEQFTGDGPDTTLGADTGAEEKNPSTPERDGVVEDEVPGENNPLQQVSSQSEKLGKKKVIIVMLALCVRNIFSCWYGLC